MNAFTQFYRKDRHIARLVIMIAAWLIFMAITRFDKFYTIVNFQTMAGQFPEFGLMSLGAMICMITGGIDLSSVGIANLASILMAMFMRSQMNEEGVIGWWVIPAAFAMAALLGAAAGTLNGTLISKVKIPPILATLGVNQLLTGVSMVVTNGNAVSKLPKAYSAAINNKILDVVPGKRGTMMGLIPVQLIFFAVAAVFIWFLLNRTAYGKKLYMMGTSENVARFSGVKVDAMLIKTYCISGVLAALGGMIMLANYNSARADYGSVYTLQCILIIVLGGVSPTGGRGKISGVLLAIVLLRLLETGINRFPQISSYYITLIWGAVLLLVMVLNYFVEHPIVRRSHAAAK
ncbi:MAG TPA: ABC transporter permease [Candidatus Aphodomonas merdavium]|nr:ABC transporter permease [Candidatus Aphodomonas merdavium]